MKVDSDGGVMGGCDDPFWETVLQLLSGVQMQLS